MGNSVVPSILSNFLLEREFTFANAEVVQEPKVRFEEY